LILASKYTSNANMGISRI